VTQSSEDMFSQIRVVMWLKEQTPAWAEQVCFLDFDAKPLEMCCCLIMPNSSLFSWQKLNFLCAGDQSCSCCQNHVIDEWDAFLFLQ
jgi:hypothetical protein